MQFRAQVEDVVPPNEAGVVEEFHHIELLIQSQEGGAAAQSKPQRNGRWYLGAFYMSPYATSGKPG